MNFITLRTITNDLLKIVRASNITSAETISLRQLEDWVHQYRAVLLKQDLDKGKKPNPDYIQNINHLRLEPVEAAGDDIVDSRNESGKFCFRTMLEVPKTLDLNFKSGFTYVGSSLGYEIQFVPEGRVTWQQYKKYTNKDSLCYLKDGHLYVIDTSPLEFITVRGIFEIPSEVGRFVNPITDQPYFNLDTKYPIPANMVPVLKEMILTKELKIEATAPSDTRNDDMTIPTNQTNKF